MRSLFLLIAASSISMISYGQHSMLNFVEENMSHNSRNEAPAVSLIPCQIIQEGHTSEQLAFTLFDDHTEADKLKLRVVSSNPEVISEKNIHLLGNGEQRTIQFTAGSHVTGNTMITVFAKDKNGEETGTSFEVHVNGMSAQY